MAKKVVSVALHKKKKPIINSSNTTKKLKSLLKNVFNYIKSDTYMFAPLLYPHSYNFTSSHVSFDDERGSSEPMKEKEKKKLAENVRNYLKCDCYMYAPYVLNISASDCTSPSPIAIGLGRDQCGEPRMEGTADRQDDKYREIENEDIFNPTRGIVVKHNLLQRESVKHVVHQNCRSSSVPDAGKGLSQKKSSPRKIVVE